MKKSKQKGKAFGGLQVFSRAKQLALLSVEKRKDGGKMGGSWVSVAACGSLRVGGGAGGGGVGLSEQPRFGV